MPSELSPAVRDFIARHIVSVEQLDILLLLHRERTRTWTAAEINQVLRSQETSVEKWLGIIIGLGLAERSGDRVRFAPASGELEQALAEVAVAYQERPIRILETIFSPRNEGLLDFVRAFDLRKRP